MENDVYRPSWMTIVYCCNSVWGLKFDCCLFPQVHFASFEKCMLNQNGDGKESV